MKSVEEQDPESLIAFLIEQLTNNLNSKLINNALKALESVDEDAEPCPLLDIKELLLAYWHATHFSPVMSTSCCTQK